MLSPTNLYDSARNRLRELYEIRESRKNVPDNEPPEKELQKRESDGKIHVWKSCGRVQYYLKDPDCGAKREYISKNQLHLFKKQIQKEYDEKVCELMEEEIVSLERMLKRAENISQKIKGLYSELPNEMKALIRPVDCFDDDFVHEWESKSYEGKCIPETKTQFVTDRGETVRSKSELNIANALKKNGIPYKYECPLKLRNGVILFPDFTVLNVRERKVIYWEHRGMMDDREYCRDSVSRIKTLCKNGIVLGDNLVVTEETSTNPLGTDEIEQVIMRVFK